MKPENLRSKKVVIGTYVPSDVCKMAYYYSSYSRSRDKLEGLIKELSGRTKVSVSNSGIERLYIGSNPNTLVAMLEVCFTYDKGRDARRTFREISDAGLMLRSNHISHLSPMIERGEYDKDLRYTREEKGRAALKWLAGIFKSVKILSINGYTGSESEVY